VPLGNGLQIYEAQLPERTCRALTIPEHESHEDLGEGFPGKGVSKKHKDLFPLDVRDAAGWLIAVLTIFIAAGATRSTCWRPCLSNQADGAVGCWHRRQIRLTAGATRCSRHWNGPRTAVG
jgi:hypothetical protein